MKRKKKVRRGHPDLNQGPLDLQSNALPLSYTPNLTATVLNKQMSFSKKEVARLCQATRMQYKPYNCPCMNECVSVCVRERE